MRLLALVLSLLLAATPAAAQGRTAPQLPDSTASRYGSSGAIVFVLTEYGLGAGGALRGRLGDDWSITAEASIGAGRDEREQSFGGGLGERITPFKRNYLVLVPIELGVERRLFRESVEDNFRPFVHVGAGPTLGFQWPYFDDLDADGLREEGEDRLGYFAGVGEGEARLGIGGSIAVGAFFGRGRRSALALRFGVRGTYFPVEVDLLELTPDVEDPSRKTFVTPTVSFHVGELW